MELTDGVINAAQKLLKQQFPAISGLQNALLGQKLCFSPLPVHTHAVQILHTGRIYIYNILFYANIIGNSHWICVDINLLPKAVKIKVMDSFGLWDLNNHTFLQICSLAIKSKSLLNVRRITTQVQQGVDCGIFAIAYSLEACMGNDLESASFDNEQMRRHLLNNLENGKLTPFPTSTTKCVKYCAEKLWRIKVYCICRMPDFYDERMIQCDYCKNWYHCKCVKVHDFAVNWTCYNCSN